MKVAVCLSGIVRGQIAFNIQRLKQAFPNADFFYGTYTAREEDLHWFLGMGNSDYYLFDEPNMHYHPILDVEEVYTHKLKVIKDKMIRGEMVKEKQKVAHHTKQILSHANLLSQLWPDYDMIIRARWDTFVSLKVEWKEWIERSYEENIAIGFGTRTSRWKDLDSFYEVPKLYPDGRDDNVSQDWGHYLMDPIIMHPRSLLDPKHAFKLHEQKKLLPAEVGWWQVLSEPTGGERHISVYGGAQIERFLNRTRYDNKEPEILT